jgi:predicted transcriptional regulator
MVVGELQIFFPPECTEDTPLETVYDMLQSSENGLIVVIDGRAHRVPIGIITEHSICEQIIRRRRDPRGLTAANVLNCKFSKVGIDDDVRGYAGQFNGSNEPVVVVDSDRRYYGLIRPREFAFNVGAEMPIGSAAERRSRNGNQPIVGLA